MISNSLDEIKDYFVSEIKERELMSKRPSKLLILTTLINLFFFYLQQVVAFLLHHL